jgi:hypothetical protein
VIQQPRIAPLAHEPANPRIWKGEHWAPTHPRAAYNRQQRRSFVHSQSHPLDRRFPAIQFVESLEHLEEFGSSIASY